MRLLIHLIVHALICLYPVSSNGILNVVTPSGKNVAMNKFACFKVALWLAVYNEFFIKNVSIHVPSMTHSYLSLSCQQKPSQCLVQVMTNDSYARRLGVHCVRLLVCFVDPKHMVKGSSPNDPLFKLFCTSSNNPEGVSFLVKAC